MEMGEGVEWTLHCATMTAAGLFASVPGPKAGIHAAMLAAERAWRASLASTSLADITRRIGRSLSADDRAKAQTWLGANVRA